MKKISKSLSKPLKERVTVNFLEILMNPIIQYSMDNCEGNFSQAVNEILGKAKNKGIF